MKTWLTESLKAALLVGAVFGVVALLLEIEALDDAARSVLLAALDASGTHRQAVCAVAALLLTALVTALQLYGKEVQRADAGATR